MFNKHLPYLRSQKKNTITAWVNVKKDVPHFCTISIDNVVKAAKLHSWFALMLQCDRNIYCFLEVCTFLNTEFRIKYSCICSENFCLLKRGFKIYSLEALAWWMRLNSTVKLNLGNVENALIVPLILKSIVPSLLPKLCFHTTCSVKKKKRLKTWWK